MSSIAEAAYRDLFGNVSPQTYPDSPGWRDAETSREAAEAFAGRANVIRRRVLELIRSEPDGLGVHQIAKRLELPVSAVQPRVSELRRTGCVRPSGRRCQNESGASAHVWIGNSQ